jgi:hypothetical protein
MAAYKIGSLDRRGGGVGLGALLVVALFCATTVQAQPSAVSVNPSSGSGASQSFTYVASSPNGHTYISSVQIILNWALEGNEACYLDYYQSSNLVYLLNDQGTSWGTGVTPGTTGTLNNSQCQINTGTMTVSGLGNNLTLYVPVSFSTAFVGSLGNYLNATDQAGNSSGWQELGTWTGHAASSQTPAVNSVTPSSGTGTAQTFEYSISDVNGYEYIGSVNLTINSSDASVNACVFSFYPNANQMYLLNNAGTAWSGPAALGSNGTPLSNNQCQLNLAGSSISGSGNNLNISLALTFTSTFTGAKNQYVQVVDHAGNYPSVGPYGTWTVGMASTPPTALSVNPLSGSGTSYTFTYVAASSNGYAYISSVQILLNWAIWGDQACYLDYYQSSNLLYLLNDDGTSWGTGVTPGTTGTLSNSQCQINTGTMTVSGEADRLTLNVPVTFLPAFIGPLGNYMNATDQAGNSSGWQELGTWTGSAASSQTPTVNSVMPSSGMGTVQPFTYSISDVNGYEYIGRVNVTINSSDASVNACVFSFYPNANQMYLLNNAGTAWEGPAALGSSGTPLSNSQCQLSLAGSSMSGSGSTLTIVLALTFTSSFTGTQNQYVQAVDHAGNYPSIGPYGTWTTETTTAITVTSAPLSRSLTVDGTVCTAPCAPFQWVPGSNHTLTVATNPQAGTTGTQYVFASWSDGLAQSHQITVPSSPATYTANFTTQFLLTTSTNPTSGEGSISPASGYVNSGTSVQVSATPASGYQLANFSGSLSGTANPQNLPMNAPAAAVANFGAACSALQIGPSVVSTTPLTPGSPISNVSLQGPGFFSVSGELGVLTWIATAPSGIFITTSGFLNGTVPSTPGTYPIPITVTNSFPCESGTVTLNLVVKGTTSGSLTITPATLPNASVGHLYSQAFGATGGSGSYSWTITGAPAWMSVSGNMISGTPTTIGTSTLQVTVTDTTYNTQKPGSFNLSVVAGTLTISPSSVPGGEVGAPYTQQTLTANGGDGTYTWSVTGTLPPGLSFTSTSTTGLLSGTPTTTTGSPFSFTISVSDTNSATGSQSFTSSIIAGPSITAPSSPLPQGTLNQAYQPVTFTATNGSGAYSWTATGLPTLLSLSPATGQLSGTPTQSGTFNNVVVTVTDSAQSTKSLTYSLTIGTSPPPLTVGCGPSANPVLVGQQVTFLAGPFGGTYPYTYSWSGTGISGTGISTTVVPSQTGTLTATISVTDSATPPNHASNSCSVTVSAAPTSTIKEYIRIGGRIIAVENH